MLPFQPSNARNTNVQHHSWLPHTLCECGIGTCIWSCGWVHIHTCACMWRSEASATGYLPVILYLNFWCRISYWIWSWPVWLDGLADGAFKIHLSSPPIPWSPCWCAQLFKWVLGVWTQALIFTVHGLVSPAPLLCILRLTDGSFSSHMNAARTNDTLSKLP